LNDSGDAIEIETGVGVQQLPNDNGVRDSIACSINSACGKCDGVGFFDTSDQFTVDFYRDGSAEITSDYGARG
jgi:hypothetical protein